MTRKISVGVIGCGYWGFNHVRTFGEHAACSLDWCSDLDQKILAKIKERYPDSQATTDYHKVIEDSRVDAVCISSPAATHFDIARRALESGKHVLVEKPITTDSGLAKQLVELADKKGLVIMPGHVYMFNAAVKKLKSMIQSGEVGDIYYINAVRASFGPIRKDVNAMWDLAPHDIYTIAHLMGEWPVSVTATGASFIQQGIEDVVFVNLKFKNGSVANIHASWISPTKTRLVAIVGDKKMIEFDDVSVGEKIKIYNKNVAKEYLHPTYANFQLSLMDGDVYIPRVPSDEPLKAECDYFLESVAKAKMDRQLCRDGVFVVSVLEAATRSLRKKSLEEKIDYPSLSI